MANSTPSVKNCPKCGSTTLVRNSRVRKQKWAKMARLGRRRVCPKCGYRYSTVEMPESEYLSLMGIRAALKQFLEENDNE
jgi:transcriptional regulator NrdR family protein